MEQRAEELTVQEYLKSGYFGGRAQKSQGKVTSIRYFDWIGNKQRILNTIKNEKVIKI